MSTEPSTEPSTERNPVLADRAGVFAELARANVTREYPNAPQHLLAGPDELVAPRTYHPAFYGAYDWHSSVHMHWLLVRLLRRYGTAFDSGAAVETLDAHLTPQSLAVEADYLRRHPSFERPYGWAWLLALASESAALGSERWSRALRPATEAVAELTLAWLRKATYPVRHGTHANSAFALGLILDSAEGAEGAGVPELREAVAAKIREWYVPDHGAASRWEPSGQDFLSPFLAEADAVRRVLPSGEFAGWLTTFLPELDAPAGAKGDFMPPPRISDPADPQIGHLFGLCLSRAAALRNLAGALPETDPRVRTLTASAEANLQAALPATTSGDFTTDHWLATFATLALDGGVR
ncbi:DUF2891 domain-containing protein [Streptomyces sp. NPDC048172]|uniref:DUF2891 domain-containing protein n=1 Tax=Streptomyces sp. NPDC048172 TaxID=3365505 RepID=UPI003713BDF8